MRNKKISILLRGVVLVMLFIAVWVWLAVIARRLDYATGATPPDWLRPIGWIFTFTGGSIGLTCVWLFLTAGRGTPAPFDPPKVFVATGPYRYVRNPMYVGAVIALVGIGFIVRSFSILILAALFWALAHIMVLYYEEPALKKRFGDSFARYTCEVNRWLPRIPSDRS